jgi:hypothetical protein
MSVIMTLTEIQQIYLREKSLDGLDALVVPVGPANSRASRMAWSASMA